MQADMYFDNDEESIPRTIRRRKKQLYESIRERMEFYFSDSNLQKDRFLMKLIKENPEVDLEIFLKFNRIHQLTNSLHDLKKALKKSEFLSLSEDKSKVYRKTPVREKANVDACTIYVEQLSSDADHDWLKLIFSRYGKVDYISIPKYKNTGKIKGFAFVEFETPEAAKAALDEFEKEGCCLTSHMNPERLCSIATYEEDKLDCKNQLSQSTDINKVGRFQTVKLTDESETKLATKRKFDSSEPDSSEEKKLKISNDNKLQEENLEECIKNDKSEMEKMDNECQNESLTETETDAPVKKKKNRKKKKSLKTKYVKDVKMYGLQILSKPDWKRLRNKYLNVQKEKMKKLKQHLYKSQMNHIHKQQQQGNNQVAESVTQPRFTFSNGVVVKVIFDEPLKDSNQVNQFKTDARTLNKVEYVDVGVGSKEGIIRFSDANAAQEMIQSKPWENMSLLEGEEEQEYWEKMKKDRIEKFENKKKFKKKRGRNKIIDKTEKLMSKRIRLSVDE